MKATLAVIDIGGTALKYGLVPYADAQTPVIPFLVKGETPSQGAEGATALLEVVYERLGFLASEAERLGVPIAGIAVSTGGMVDVRDGSIFYAGPTIPGYGGTPLGEDLRARFDVPVEVENDVKCAGLAEALLGAAKGADSALCLTVGTGIGGCFLMDGHIWHGHGLLACEVGYLPMHGSDFQTLASTTALVKDVEVRKGEEAGTWDGRRIFRAIEAGDADCMAALEMQMDYLAEGITTLCLALNPEVVVLGGGIMAQREILFPMLDARLKARMVPPLYESTRIAFADLGNDAGMLGAAIHYRQRREAMEESTCRI